MMEPEASPDPRWKILLFEWTKGSAAAAGWELLSLVPQSKMLRLGKVGWVHFSKQAVLSEQAAAGATADSDSRQDRRWLCPPPEGRIHGQAPTLPVPGLVARMWSISKFLLTFLTSWTKASCDFSFLFSISENDWNTLEVSSNLEEN